MKFKLLTSHQMKQRRVVKLALQKRTQGKIRKKHRRQNYANESQVRTMMQPIEAAARIE